MSTGHIWLTVATLAVGAWAAVANAQSTVHLYIYDTHTGVVTQATPTMDFEPYNASFSNDGKKLVHDLVIQGGPPQTLGVTNLATGEMTSLGLEGDNAVWSPNGQYIAYGNWSDCANSGCALPVQLRVIPAAGGTPVSVRDWALDPSWSNNSRRLAFVDQIDFYIGTVGLDGSETKFDFDTLGSIEGYGCNPAYSPDGKLIVYQRYECYFGVPGPLMAIPVNEKGQALSAPYASRRGHLRRRTRRSRTTARRSCSWDTAFSGNGRYVVFSGPEE